MERKQHNIGRTYAARRARNAAWLYVYRDLFESIWWRVAEPGHFPRISEKRLYRKQAARGLAYIYPNTCHTAFKLAGLARVCQHRGVQAQAWRTDVLPFRSPS